MFESIYVGLTGLASFSRNLTVIGNNVSNLNTAGFKNSQLSFSDLAYRAAFSDRNDGAGADVQLGSGVGTGSTRVVFTQGNLRDTGNPTDLAVDGNGFFVLRNPDTGAALYTRNGEFEFDQAGFLVARSGAGRVAALQDGALVDLSVASLRTTPPQPTSVVRFSDNLDTAGSTTVPHNVNVTVFDAAGGAVPLVIAITRNAAVGGSWLLQVKDQAGNNLAGASGEIRFSNGSPAPGFNTFTFTLTRPGGVPSTSITLDFGVPGSISSATAFSGTTTLKLASQDGVALGSLVSAAFQADGSVQASYSNGKTALGPRVALAFFASPQELEATGGALYENRTRQEVALGDPRSGVFGSLRGGTLESANVDLAAQFSELIVTQRGYQASSQVITTANEMMDQLFQISGRR